MAQRDVRESYHHHHCCHHCYVSHFPPGMAIHPEGGVLKREKFCAKYLLSPGILEDERLVIYQLTTDLKNWVSSARTVEGESMK